MKPKNKSIKLGQFYALKGKLLKLMGDNAKQVSDQIRASELKEKAIKSLETIENIPALKFNLGYILDEMISFGKFSRNEQTQKAARIMEKFKVLTAKTYHLRTEERRKICSAASNFFASIGSYKTAEQYIQKLESLEQKDAVRDSAVYCQTLRNQFKNLKYEKYKQKINSQKVLYYSEAVRNLENAISFNPKTDYLEQSIVSCLSITTFLPKLAETFIEKAYANVTQGLELYPNHEILNNLSKTIQSLNS